MTGAGRNRAPAGAFAPDQGEGQGRLAVHLDNLPLPALRLSGGPGAGAVMASLGLSGRCQPDDTPSPAALTLSSEGLRIRVWRSAAPLPRGEIPASLTGLIWAGAASVFYLCDTATIPGGNGLASWPDLRADCLFTGEAAKQLENVAPYLVELGPDELFARRLFDDDGQFWSLWPHGCGIFLRSRAERSSIRQNLRRFTKLMDGDRWVFLRLAEPGTLVPLLLGLAPGSRGRLFQGIDSIIAIDPREGLVIEAICTDPPDSTALRVEPQLKATLDAAIRAKFARDAVRFCRDSLPGHPGPTLDAANDNAANEFGRAALWQARCVGLHDRHAVLMATAAAWCAASADASWIARQTDLVQDEGTSQIEKARALLRRAIQGQGRSALAPTPESQYD